MKTQPMRLFCSFCALSGIFYFGKVASAQGSLNSSSSTRLGSSMPHHTSKDSTVKDILDHPRLRFKVSIERRATTIEQALNKLSEYTPLHLVVEDAEMRATPLCFRYSATPLRDILASIAETEYGEWAWKNENTLVLKPRHNSHLLDVHRPHNEAQKEVYQHGAALLGQIGNLSPDMQAALNSSNQASGVPFNNLPPAMQDNLQAMFAANAKNIGSQGGNSPLSAADLSHSTVHLQPGTPQEGFTPFDVVLSADLPGGVRAGVGMSFNMFHDPQDPNDVIPEDQITPIDNNSAALDALSRQKALANNRHLQDKVSLKVANATFFQALQALCTKANIAFSSQYPPEKGKQVQRTFSLPTMTLGEMLDKVTALYGAKDDEGKLYRYTWGQQGDLTNQVLVFHISLEPGR